MRHSGDSSEGTQQAAVTFDHHKVLALPVGAPQEDMLVARARGDHVACRVELHREHLASVPRQQHDRRQQPGGALGALRSASAPDQATARMHALTGARHPQVDQGTLLIAATTNAALACRGASLRQEPWLCGRGLRAGSVACCEAGGACALPHRLGGLGAGGERAIVLCALLLNKRAGTAIGIWRVRPLQI